MEVPPGLRAEMVREQIASTLSADLDRMAARATRTQVHQIIPVEFFSAASSECRQMFIFGNFYGCICLAQAVAEGLARHIVRIRKLPGGTTPEAYVAKLAAEKFITPEAKAAFHIIWGDDRNDYHHLNPTVETDYAQLEARSEACVNALWTIESELFGYSCGPGEGSIMPTHPE